MSIRLRPAARLCAIPAATDEESFDVESLFGGIFCDEGSEGGACIHAEITRIIEIIHRFGGFVSHHSKCALVFGIECDFGADGGFMTTKPYISGSNYLLKMGDWDKKTTLTLPNNETVSWTAIWDGLFWRFMHTHRAFFSKNPRLGMLLKTWDKMDQPKKDTHLRLANNFLQQLDSTK